MGRPSEFGCKVCGEPGDQCDCHCDDCVRTGNAKGPPLDWRALYFEERARADKAEAALRRIASGIDAAAEAAERRDPGGFTAATARDIGRFVRHEIEWAAVEVTRG